MKKRTKVVLIIILALVVLIALIFPFSYVAGEILWWKSVGYTGVYLKIIFLQTVSFVLPFLFSYSILNLWFYVMHRAIGSTFLNIVIWGVSIACGVWGALYWKLFIWNVGAQATGFYDPIFHLDAYFYMFRLPLIRMMLIMINIFFFILLILDLIVRSRSTKPVIKRGKIRLGGSTRTLLTANVIALIGYIFINLFEVLVSQPNPKLGIGYSEVYGLFYGYYIFTGIIILIYILFFFQSRKGIKITRLAVYLVIVVLSFFGLTMLYPRIIEDYYVKPNELMKQKDFINYRLQCTRKGFNIAFEDYSFNHNIPQDLPVILDHMRIWDNDPYRKVVKQVQEIKTYFDFADVDVGKYTVSNETVQAILAARELNIQNLPVDAVSWDNIHLRYTHGYGVIFSPASKVNRNGNPVFWIRNLNNETDFPELQLDYPQIYFGEMTSNYIVVKTTTEELEYSTDTNRITTVYQADRGISIGSFFGRLIYSIVLGEKMFMLTEYFTRDSRLLYRRQIHERVKYIFPYLEYDDDPYIAVINGKLYWIMDAFTVSDRFPLSQRFSTPYGKINYMRNSVKVVIDAYTGDVTYYVVDETDPIINSYRFIFPELFKREIPPEIQSHFRYPVSQFKIQAEILCTYHVDNYESFYNGEDAWKIPEQIYGDKKEQFQPYFTLAKVGDKYQFSLINPFNPIGKENLSSWLIAYYDNGHRLTLKYVDKTSSSFGPMQIESRINQDDNLSRLFSLWNQKGSKVFRGNIQFIPVQNTILYLEPIFLESEENSIPQLVKILAVVNGMVFQGDNVKDLVYNIQNFITASKPGSGQIRDLVNQAYLDYLDAERFRIDGNLKAYQESVDKIGRALKEATSIAEQ